MTDVRNMTEVQRELLQFIGDFTHELEMMEAFHADDPKLVPVLRSVRLAAGIAESKLILRVCESPP